MLTIKSSLASVVVGLAICSAAQAQSATTDRDRPFVFSISTPQTDQRHTTVHLDAGYSDRPFDVVESDRAEQRFGVQASVGRGFTVLARIGVASEERDQRSSQQGELLYSVVRAPAHDGSVAVGMGLRHESAGANVLLGRVAAGRRFNDWRVDGNALFEKPFSVGRDTLDLVTSVGIARRVLPAFHVGIEMIGEDLEGFWEVDEAEGGARLLVGPSIRFAPTATRWQLSAAGGPVFHGTRSARTSDATRGLPSSAKNGYALRASLSYGF